jgi:hypothetical protein
MTQIFIANVNNSTACKYLYNSHSNLRYYRYVIVSCQQACIQRLVTKILLNQWLPNTENLINYELLLSLKWKIKKRFANWYILAPLLHENMFKHTVANFKCRMLNLFSLYVIKTLSIDMLRGIIKKERLVQGRHFLNFCWWWFLKIYRYNICRFIFNFLPDCKCRVYNILHTNDMLIAPLFWIILSSWWCLVYLLRAKFRVFFFLNACLHICCLYESKIFWNLLNINHKIGFKKFLSDLGRDIYTMILNN